VASFKYWGTAVKVLKSLCTTEHHIMKAYWGTGGASPRIPDLSTWWRWVVRL